MSTTFLMEYIRKVVLFSYLHGLKWLNQICLNFQREKLTISFLEIFFRKNTDWLVTGIRV